ncbi:hypothetical protein BI364_13705 [Acidihalobacter yilgarnensis]|uniref:Uncharacterized protein n=1 Tax=Acidihalobacter yilgarnensis TaxID=2819280 RepID=A0A1D8IR64_9GAMM|nr:hypothetical protein [Acidihalobacter yilgarnensis]AOU98873.1 hypothetical protein BI364_13705 [Acidihalobacter yilgarnensis]
MATHKNSIPTEPDVTVRPIWPTPAVKAKAAPLRLKAMEARDRLNAELYRRAPGRSPHAHGFRVRQERRLRDLLVAKLGVERAANREDYKPEGWSYSPFLPLDVGPEFSTRTLVAMARPALIAHAEQISDPHDPLGGTMVEDLDFLVVYGEDPSPPLDRLPEALSRLRRVMCGLRRAPGGANAKSLDAVMRGSKTWIATETLRPPTRKRAIRRPFLVLAWLFFVAPEAGIATMLVRRMLEGTLPVNAHDVLGALAWGLGASAIPLWTLLASRQARKRRAALIKEARDQHFQVHAQDEPMRADYVRMAPVVQAIRPWRDLARAEYRSYHARLQRYQGHQAKARAEESRLEAEKDAARHYSPADLLCTINTGD